MGEGLGGMGMARERKTFRCAVIAADDGAYAGERRDDATPAAARALKKGPFRLTETVLLPLDRAMLSARLRELCDAGETELILVLGGVGPALTDCVPEATLDVVGRTLPGISEFLRRNMLERSPAAILNRGAAGVYKSTLAVDLPGEAEELGECLPPLLPLLTAALEELREEKKELSKEERRYG